MRLKRVTVRLPEDSPVFALPEGARSEYVRQQLELADRLSRVEENLAQLAGLIQKLLEGAGAHAPAGETLTTAASPEVIRTLLEALDDF